MPPEVMNETTRQATRNPALDTLTPNAADYAIFEHARAYLPIESLNVQPQMPSGLKRSSNSQIDKAGKTISSVFPREKRDGVPDDQLWNDAFAVLSDWRTLHAYPLNAIAMTLRRRSNAVAAETLVAQRLKRFVSIRQKLLDKPGMALSRMQDIAGCRAVVPKIEDVYRLKRQYEDYARKCPKRGPEFLGNAIKDYIFEPKDDGYRGIHIVMRYRTENPIAAVSNDTRVEIQIRSRLQHAWAMAVETVSSATAQSLKAGRGREEWKQFFRLMASAIALKEDMPMVPGTDELSIYREVRQLALELRVVSLLETVRPALELVIADEHARAEHPDDLYLLALDAEKNTVTYEMFPRNHYVDALQAYSAAERMHVNNPNVHSVLVSVRNIESLRSAYPSYFMDMKEFITLIRETVDFGADHRPITDADQAGLLGDDDWFVPDD